MGDDLREDVAAYYQNAQVWARLSDYCAGDDGQPSAAYVAGFDPSKLPNPTWTDATVTPGADIASLAARGGDLARSLWDTTALIFLLDLDYQNLDYPGRPSRTRRTSSSSSRTPTRRAGVCSDDSASRRSRPQPAAVTTSSAGVQQPGNRCSGGARRAAVVVRRLPDPPPPRRDVDDVGATGNGRHGARSRSRIRRALDPAGG